MLTTSRQILEKIKWKEHRDSYRVGIAILLMLIGWSVIYILVFKPLTPFSNSNYSASRKEALQLFHSGNIQEAIIKLESIVQEEPSDITTKSYLASSYILVGRNQDAEKILISILEADEDNIEALYRLGIVYRNIDEKKQSIENLKKAVELQKNNMMFREELVRSYIIAEDYDDALFQIKKIILHKSAAKERIPYYWEQLGDIYLLNKEQKAAVLAFKKSLSLKVNSRVKKKLSSLTKVNKK